MVPMSLDQILWYTTIKIVRNSRDWVIFLTVYLLWGALISLIKSTTLKLAIMLTWDIEIIGHYILSAAKMINKLMMIDKIPNVVQTDLDLTELIRLKFGIQTRVQRLAALVDTFILEVATLPSHRLELKDISSASIYIKRISLPPPETEQYQEHAYLRDNNMYNSRVNYQKIRNVPKPKNTKRIEFSEILGEGEETNDDTLIST